MIGMCDKNNALPTFEQLVAASRDGLRKAIIAALSGAAGAPSSGYYGRHRYSAIIALPGTLPDAEVVNVIATLALDPRIRYTICTIESAIGGESRKTLKFNWAPMGEESTQAPANDNAKDGVEADGGDSTGRFPKSFKKYQKRVTYRS